MARTEHVWTGVDAAVLAILANASHLKRTKEVKALFQRLLDSLGGSPWRVGNLILGLKINRPTKKEVSMADAFNAWADRLGTWQVSGEPSKRLRRISKTRSSKASS